MATTTESKPLARAVLRSQPDDRLVKLTRQGRELAFDEIVRRYRPGLVAFATAYAPSERAEDVVQESLVRSWEALRDSSAEIRLKPWLYTIVRNRALNARRDAKIHQPLDETIDGVRQPSEIALTNDELARVVVAVNGLPEPQREALVRSALDGNTHEQIAKALQTSPGAVRQLIYRARATLRNGFGLLLPLPLLATLAGGGSGSAAAGAAAAGAVGTAGGGSLALKGATAAAVGVVAIGGGVAIERSIGGKDENNQASAAERGGQPDAGGPGAASDPADGGPGGDGGSSPSTRAADGGSGASLNEGGSSDGGGQGSESRGDGGGTADGDDRGTGGGEGSSGPSANGGNDAGDDPPETDDDGEGGSGSSGHGGSGESDSDGEHGSGSGHGGSGSGSSGSGDDDDPPEPLDDPDDSSGSGSGSSGSGSGGSGSGSGGPGSGDEPVEPDEPPAY